MTQPASTITSFKIIEVCSLAPLQGTTPSNIPKTLPLTFYDLLWLRFPPPECLFFYPFPHDSSAFYDSVLPNLKHSLSFALHHFLPLAGNITWPRDSPYPVINYVPGNTVPFTIAESHTENFNLLCSNKCEVNTERQRLIPCLNTSHEQASILALQVTLFPNFGFCIGKTAHHAAADGKSVLLFLKAWAYACSKLGDESPLSSLPDENLTPFFDRSVIKDPRGISEAYVDAWLKDNGPYNRSLKVWDSTQSIQGEAIKSLFELTPSHIQKLKQYAQSKMKTKIQLSSFSVTCAYLWSCLVKVEQPKDEKVALVFSVDCRPRSDPPIPPTYFGNCVVGHRVELRTKNIVEKDGFVSALEGIVDALNRVKDGVLSGVENAVSEILNEKENRIFSVAGSPQFEFYNVDFGWGKPKKVDMTSIDGTGAFSFFKSGNDNGGIEVGLTLKKCDMEAFSTLLVQGLESL